MTTPTTSRIRFAVLLSAFPVACVLGGPASPAKLEIAKWTADLASPLTPSRMTAAEALGKAGASATGAVPALIGTLRDENVVVRSHAAWALGKIAVPAETIIPALMERIQDGAEEWPVRHNAALSLSWIGQPAVAALRKSLSHPDAWVRAYAADSLFRIGPADAIAAEVIPVVRKLMTQPSPPIRGYAVTLAGKFGPAARAAVPDVARLLSDPDVEVRKLASQVFPQFGREGRVAIPQLLATLREDQEQWVRAGAAGTLGLLGEPTPEILRGLIEAFHDKKERVRAIAAEAIAQFGEPAVPLLVAALKSATKETKMGVADAFAIMGTRAATKAPAASVSLIPLLRSDPEWEVRFRAATALGGLNVATETVLSALNEGLKDEHEVVRLNAGDALRKLQKPSPTG